MGKNLDHPNGRTAPTLMTATPFTDQDLGTHLLSTMTLSDFDELNEGLARMQRLAGLGALTASVAHELSNPMSIITATCNNLLSQIADDKLNMDQLLHYIEMVDHSAWRCARIIQTLRTYAHPETTPMADTDLNKIIEDAQTLVAYQFNRQFHVEIEVELAPDLPAVVCDANQIIQVLLNLLINARDALPPPGGAIRIISRPLPDEAAVLFSVSDSGAGIAPEILDKIFEPFFTTKSAEEGSGLGLSIAAGIVARHHGRLEVTNNPDAGATFTVVLPCRQERADVLLRETNVKREA